MVSAVARPIRSWSKLLTSSTQLSLQAAVSAAPLVFLVRPPLGPADVNAELLGRPEHLFVELPHLDLGPVGGQDLHVEAEALHLLDQHLEALGDARLRDV